MAQQLIMGHLIPKFIFLAGFEIIDKGYMLLCMYILIHGWWYSAFGHIHIYVDITRGGVFNVEDYVDAILWNTVSILDELVGYYLE